jgi:hypothetical protein
MTESDLGVAGLRSETMEKRVDVNPFANASLH